MISPRFLIPVFRFENATEEDLERIDDNCAICLKPLSITNTKKLPCQHFFHKWFSNSRLFFFLKSILKGRRMQSITFMALMSMLKAFLPHFMVELRSFMCCFFKCCISTFWFISPCSRFLSFFSFLFLNIICRFSPFKLLFCV